MLTSQPILPITSLANSLSKLTHISMVWHILHGQAACSTAATVSHALDLYEVGLAQVQQGSVVGNLLHVPAFHKRQPIHEHEQVDHQG